MAASTRVALGVVVGAASLGVIWALLPASAVPIWGATVLALVTVEWARRRTSLSSQPVWPITVAAAAIPVGLMLGLYWRATRAWWLGDDPAILWAVVSHGIAPHFWAPAVWREFSSNNLTPWEILSYGLDWRLFGLDPTGYYWHQLTSLAVVLVLALVVLNRFVTAGTASLTLCLFVASVPVATVAQQLMTRHYVEGLGLALASTGLFVRAIDRRSTALSWLGGAAYLAACSAKEVLVPLVLVLPFLPVGEPKTRLRTLRPYLMALAAYLPWRAWMLGPSHLVAGYGSLFSGSGGGSPSAVGARVAGVLGWGRIGAIAMGVVLVGLLAALVGRRAKPTLLLVAAAAAASAGPLLPVLGVLDPRMLLVAYFALCVGLGAAVGLLGGSPGRQVAATAASMALLAVGVAAAVGSPLWVERSALDRYRVEGMTVLTGSPDLPLLQPAGPPWFYTCLGRLRNRLYGSPGPQVCYDACACSAADHHRTGLRFASGTMSEAALDQAACRFRVALLTVEFSYETRTDTLRWSLGPYRQGRWYYIDETGYGQPVPARGFYPLRLSAPSVFTVRYVSGDGWSTQTPRLQLDPSVPGPDGIVRVSWSGEGGLSGATAAPGT